MRHDIKDCRVFGSRVIYPGKVRAPFIDPSAERAVGATVPLTLERFADHPELEAQFMRDDLPVSEAELRIDGQP